MHLLGSLSTFIKWLSEHTMQLNNGHYSNGFQRAEEKEVCTQMGVILRSSSAPQEIHFFDSYAISQMYINPSPHAVSWGFQPPKPRLVNSHHTSAHMPHALQLPGTILFLLLHPHQRHSEMLLLSGIIFSYVTFRPCDKCNEICSLFQLSESQLQGSSVLCTNIK